MSFLLLAGGDDLGPALHQTQLAGLEESQRVQKLLLDGVYAGFLGDFLFLVVHVGVGETLKGTVFQTVLVVLRCASTEAVLVALRCSVALRVRVTLPGLRGWLAHLTLAGGLLLFFKCSVPVVLGLPSSNGAGLLVELLGDFVDGLLAVCREPHILGLVSLRRSRHPHLSHLARSPSVFTCAKNFFAK